MFEVYEPGEDSYTFYDVLESEKLKNLLIVDLGCSTGYLTDLLEKENIVISIDINMTALLKLDENKTAIKMDLLHGLDQSKLDCVVFNPPYVPDFDCPILGGGEHGRSVIDRFIDQIDVSLFYLLIIEANNPQEVIQNIEEKSYKVQILKIRKVIGETIIILKCSKQIPEM